MLTWKHREQQSKRTSRDVFFTQTGDVHHYTRSKYFVLGDKKLHDPSQSFNIDTPFSARRCVDK